MQYLWPVKRMTSEELDQVALRLEEIEAESNNLRSRIQEQVEEFGFTPPRAEKSKRLLGALYQFTLSRGLTTEVKDGAVERLRACCPRDLFDRLFRVITKYKLADGATAVLANRLPPDAPRNLRQLFSAAIVTKENSPRLRIEKALAEAAAT